MAEKRKHISRIMTIMLAALCLCLPVLNPRPVYAKTATTLTVYDTLMNIGDSIDLRDIVEVTSGYDGTLQFSITQMTYTDAASIVGNRLYVYKSGKITISITAPETTKYSSATEVLYINVMGKALNFSPSNQTVKLSSGTVDLKSFCSMPSDYSGTLSFASSDKTVATVKGSTATLLSAGTTKITVTAPATEVYAAAKKTFDLTVTAQTLSITVKTISVAADAGTLNLNNYVSVSAGDYPGTLSYTITSGGSMASVSGSTLNISGAGTVQMKVTAPAAGGYSAAEKSFTVTITPVTALTSFKTSTVTMGSTVNLDSLLTKNSRYTGAVTYSVVSGPGKISGNILTPTGAGTIKVSAKAAATSIFSASEVTTTITSSRRPTSISATSATKYRDDAAIKLSSLISVTAGYDGTLQTSVSGSSISISGDTISYTGIGTSTVTVTAPQTAACDAAQTTFTVTVRRHGTSITTSDITRYRDDAPVSVSSLLNISPGYNGTIQTSVSGSSISISGDTIRYTGIGTSTVTVTAPQTGSYEAAQASFKVTVRRHDTTITASDITKNRDDASVTIDSLISVTSGYNGTINATAEGGSVSIVAGRLQYNSTGTTVIHVTAPETDSYAGAATSFKVTVVMRPSTLTTRDIVLTRSSATATISDYYTASGSPLSPTYRITEGADVISISNGNVRATKVGTAKILITLPESAGFSETSAVLTVTVKGEKTQITNKGDVRTEYGASAIRLTDRVSVSAGYDGELSVTVDGDAVSYRNGVLTPALAGDATVIVKAPSTVWYEGAETSFHVYVAGKSPELKTRQNSISVDYGKDTFLISDLYQTAGGYDGTVTASVTSGKDVIEIKNGKVTLTGAGTATLTLTAGATKGYLSEESAVTFSVRPISPELNAKPAIAICGGASVDLSELVSFAADSKQKPSFSLSDGKELASIAGSRLTVDKLGKISVRVSLPAAGPYDTESAVIDVTVVEIACDNAEAKTENYYNAPIEASIRITGDNFRENDYPEQILTAKGGTPTAGKWTKIGEISVLPLIFEEDGSYTFHSPGQKDDILSFTIDQKAPAVSVKWSKEPANKQYYNDSVTATIRILDENPLPGKPEIFAERDGKKLMIPDVSEWKEDNDGLYATVTFKNEGEYRISMKAEDKAGNESKEYTSGTFIIDLTPPDLSVTGIEDGCIYKESLTVQISCADDNLGEGKAAVTASGVRHEEHKISCTELQPGITECKIGAGSRDQDDAYTLTITCTDLAGNPATKTIRYGINCFGSDFTWENPANYLGDGEKIEISERNVSPVRSSIVTVGCNGTIRQLEEGADYKKTETRDEGLYLYRYEISADILEEDGYYEILINTEDEAENRQSNTSKDCPVRFAVDRTDPECVITGLEDGRTYNANQVPYQVIVSDNLSVERLAVYINEEEIGNYSAEDIERTNGKIQLTIAEMNGYQTVRAEVWDASGRNGETVVRVLVATNPFIRFWNNKALVVGVLAGTILVLGGIVFLLIRRTSKRRQAA